MHVAASRDEFKCGKWRALAWMICVLWVGACGALPSGTTSILAPAPNLYTFDTGEDYPADTVPKGLRRILTEILYVTDRMPVLEPDGTLARYGNDRNPSMAFGVSLVEYGDLESWDELVTRTQSPDKSALTRLTPVYMEEFTRFPATPLPFSSDGSRSVVAPAAAARYDQSIDVMRRELSVRLQNHDLNRVLVYIHGVNNEFDDSLGTLANLWHYSGRRSLPVAYSWPAGNSGVLSYFRDAQAGEYSVFHVKEFLRMLASVPEVDRIDIVAHSRGSAVMTDALRELIIEARAKGQEPRRALKTGILLLAAPDVDIGVAQQRLVAEHFSDGFEQVTIYANPDDRALNLSRIIGNAPRLGSIDLEADSNGLLRNLAQAGNVDVVIVEQAGGNPGHAYFRENPAVISDIVLALRTRQEPGTAFRPLEPLAPHVWALHPSYPAEELPADLDAVLADR